MKNFAYGVGVTFILALIFELMGFWQAAVIAGLIGSLCVDRSDQAFLIGSTGVVLCWLSLLIYGEIVHNTLPLMRITAKIFMLPENLAWLLPLATLLIGGILGGLGGLNSVWWKKVILNKGEISWKKSRNSL